MEQCPKCGGQMVVTSDVRGMAGDDGLRCLICGYWMPNNNKEPAYIERETLEQMKNLNKAKVGPKPVYKNRQGELTICPVCLRARPVAARGMCGACYAQLLKRNKREMDTMAKPTEIAAPEEPALKKGDKFICPVCGKYRSYDSHNMCGTCRKKQYKSAVVDAVPESFAVDVGGGSDVAVVLPDDFGKVVVDGDKVSFGVDCGVDCGVDEVYWLALEDAWNEKRREWFAELCAVKPVDGICYAAKMINAVKQLGY